MGGQHLRMIWGQEVCYTSLLNEPASARTELANSMVTPREPELLRDGNFACRIHPKVQSAIGFHCVCSVVGWLIVYLLAYYVSLSSSQYSQTICWRGWDDNAFLGARNTCSIGAWPNSLDRRPPWYCIVSPLLQTIQTKNYTMLSNQTWSFLIENWK